MFLLLEHVGFPAPLLHPRFLLFPQPGTSFLVGAWACLPDCAFIHVKTAALLKNAQEASNSSSKATISSKA